MEDELAKDRKLKGGPCQGSNLSRHMGAWANVADRDMGWAGLEIREKHVLQAKELGPAGDQTHWQVFSGHGLIRFAF